MVMDFSIRLDRTVLFVCKTVADNCPVFMFNKAVLGRFDMLHTNGPHSVRNHTVTFDDGLAVSAVQLCTHQFAAILPIITPCPVHKFQPE